MAILYTVSICRPNCLPRSSYLAKVWGSNCDNPSPHCAPVGRNMSEGKSLDADRELKKALWSERGVAVGVGAYRVSGKGCFRFDSRKDGMPPASLLEHSLESIIDMSTVHQLSMHDI